MVSHFQSKVSSNVMPYKTNVSITNEYKVHFSFLGLNLSDE